MEFIYVGIGEFAVSRNPNHILKTMALGSCVGVIVRDAKSGGAGLLHVALPDSSINQKRAQEKPGSFADTGIPALLKAMRKVGYDGTSRLTVKLTGGASIMDPNNTFNIGKRNILAIKKILWGFRMGAISEDLGGSISRSVSVEIETGRVTITSPGRGQWDL